MGQHLAQATQLLRSAGVENAQTDARRLFCHVLGVDRTSLWRDADRPISVDDAAAYARLVDRRAAREPLSHLLGEVGFWTLDLRVTPDVLTPRPDSETVVEAVLAHLPKAPPALRVLDLGTGSGCLLLALLSALPEAWGVGVDRSQAALAVARDNAARHHLAARCGFVCADWLAPMRVRFDVVVSNPPYIKRTDLGALEPEVARHEPHLALDGGIDGLDAYRALTTTVPAHLEPGGLLAFEVGFDQAQAVALMCERIGLVPIEIRRDLAGIERCVLATQPGPQRGK